MPAFVLAETPAGYGLFKASDKKLFKKDVVDIEDASSTPEGINKLLTLKKFSRFDSAANAVNEVSGILDGKVPPMLLELLSEIKDEKKANLAVADPKLAIAIKKIPDFDISTVSDSTTAEIYRGIRSHLSDLIPGLLPDNIKTMSLGLSHSLSRHKLKFSADKVDTMIVHTVSLIEDSEKELNIKAMRVKEWYGWHFPELAKILNDNVAYARFIVNVGMRQNTHGADLDAILPEELGSAVKAAAEVSMGTEMMEEDLESITRLAQEVIDLTAFRSDLSSYLTSRMAHIAPNLTELVGPLVGAKLVSKTGSLVNLAKAPGSTIQILGAEKALFRALKTKHATPKYGLIYHASLVGQANAKNKGKIARMLSAKVAITSRTDALSSWGSRGEQNADEVDDEIKTMLGVKSRVKVENRLRMLEGRLVLKGTAIGPTGSGETWEAKRSRLYSNAADGFENDEPKANGKDVEMADAPEEDDDEDEDMADADAAAGSSKKSKKAKKEKKQQGGEADAEVTALSEADYERFAEVAGISVSKFKRKYERGDFTMGEDGTPQVMSKKDSKKKRQTEETDGAISGKKRKHDDDGETKTKKKKKKSKSE